MFAAWLELAEGNPEPQRLWITAVPVLGVILDTLLRAHDFETFETLVGLLTRSDFPRREQRELLAVMYLEHGFLASAAQEWMAVCQTSPDARALYGLAKVAQANGQLEDVVVFAGEAVRLDPGHLPARELLDRASAAQSPVPA